MKSAKDPGSYVKKGWVGNLGPVNIGFHEY